MQGYLSPEREILMSVDLSFTQRKALETLVSAGGFMPLMRMNLSRSDCTYLQNKNLIKVPAISKGRWIEISEVGLQALGQEIKPPEVVEAPLQSVVEAREAFLQAMTKPQPSTGWTAADVSKAQAGLPPNAPAPLSAKISDLPAPGRGVPLSSVSRDILDFSDPLFR